MVHVRAGIARSKVSDKVELRTVTLVAKPKQTKHDHTRSGRRSTSFQDSTSSGTRTTLTRSVRPPDPRQLSHPHQHNTHELELARLASTLQAEVADLERRVQELVNQNREERVRSLVDLRVASGLISESERNKSEAVTAKLNDESLQMIRHDLLKIFARLNAAKPAESTAVGATSYIG